MTCPVNEGYPVWLLNCTELMASHSMPSLRRKVGGVRGRDGALGAAQSAARLYDVPFFISAHLFNGNTTALFPTYPLTTWD